MDGSCDVWKIDIAESKAEEILIWDKLSTLSEYINVVKLSKINRKINGFVNDYVKPLKNLNYAQLDWRNKPEITRKRRIRCGSTIN